MSQKPKRTLTDDELDQQGYAVGLDVWDPVRKAYTNFIGDSDLADSQLASLEEAIREDATRT